MPGIMSLLPLGTHQIIHPGMTLLSAFFQLVGKERDPVSTQLLRKTYIETRKTRHCIQTKSTGEVRNLSPREQHGLGSFNNYICILITLEMPPTLFIDVQGTQALNPFH